ncbi:aspartate/glutamate racemase family protein [Gaoshiqia sp. Z1-71]|uniref:aspartate/glutamate racemase family protein n=1 Tax=Gaoshiqia hydrogeniformans TaxID=3290090 RepID=UPI003BF7EA7D
MRKIGILGGLGPEATVDYYKEIISAFNDRNAGGELSYPEMVIYSVNMSVFIGFLENRDDQQAAEYLANCINRMEKAGVDFAVISANTPHLLFNEIRGLVNLPLISIVEACKNEARKQGLKRCGLLGTKFTMNARFYADSFKEAGIDVFSPGRDEIEKINRKLFTELELGIFKEETKNELLEIVGNMIDRHEIDSVILGCTEFPLMFQDDRYLGIPFLNTSRIHVEALVKYCTSGD